MRQLTCTAPGVLEWRDVPEPRGPDIGEAVVRPLTVARCELDPLLIASGPTSAAGFAVGHEAIVEVVAVGESVTNVREGDLAGCSFQLCCGQCEACAGGHTALCEAYPILSDYGMQPLSGTEYGGMLSDLVLVPHADAMLVPVPTGLDPITIASAADNIADGYRAVAPHLAESPGSDVLVVCHGGPSIALYATWTAIVLGAPSVTFETDDEPALRAAAAMGATATRTDFGRRAGRWPLVVDCGTRRDGLVHAIESTEPEGTLHSVSYYADAMTPIPLGKLYTRGISFYTGRVHSAAVLGEVLALLERHPAPALVPPTVIAWDDAPERYAADDALKLVVARSPETMQAVA